MRAFGVNSVIAGVLWLCLLLGSVCSAGEAIGDVIDVQPGESIQAAIDAAPNGATIRIASGEYEEHLTIRKEITLIGSADPEAPTVLAAPSLYPVITFLEEAEAVLESLHVVATTRFETDAVAVYGSADVVIRGVEVRGSRGNGINVHSTGRIEIVGCAIHSNQRFAIVVQTSGATVFGGNNDLRGNGAELGRFAPPTLRTPLAAQTESTYVQVPVDYPTVQAAIDAVAPGGTVEVASGSFSEALTIWKRLTLLGHGDTTELDAPDEALYGGVVLNSAQSISLERVAFGRAWTICGGTALLRDVDVSCRDDVGIELERRAAASLHSVRVQGVHGPGLLVATDSSALLEDCTFAECYDGILVEDRGHVEATACAFESCRVSGLSVASREATATVQECSFLDNADGVSSSGGLTIERCVFGRQVRAVYVLGGEAELSGCAIRGSRDAGLHAFAGLIWSQDCVIAETEGESAVFCEQSGRVEMIACTVAENLGYGVCAQQDGQIDATDCTITDNGLSHDEWADSAGVSVRDNAIVRLDGCAIGRNAGFGIEFGYPTFGMQVDPSIPESAEPECELQMIDCRVFENVWDGLYVFDGHLVEIRQTEFEQNYANGIWIEPFFEGLFVLTDCQIEDHPESGVVVSGGTVVQLERCTIARSGRIGVFVGDSASLAIHACLILDNLIGVSLVESPFVLLTDCEIRGNLGYGLVVYCLECSGGRHLHDPEIDFTGELTGGGNVIPDASGLDGNGLGGICPAGPWEFLRVGGTEASDV